LPTRWAKSGNKGESIWKQKGRVGRAGPKERPLASSSCGVGGGRGEKRAAGKTRKKYYTVVGPRMRALQRQLGRGGGLMERAKFFRPIGWVARQKTLATEGALAGSGAARGSCRLEGKKIGQSAAGCKGKERTNTGHLRRQAVETDSRRRKRRKGL